MEGCYYVGVGAVAFGWTQIIPTITTLCFFVASSFTNKPMLLFFSLYLYIPQITIYCFQHYFQVIMPDPVCQLYHSYAFPSMSAFYVGALFAGFVTATYLFNYSHGWNIWIVMELFLVIPPIILVYYSYNRWWEVVLSVGFGVANGVFFMVVYKWYIYPSLPYLSMQFPMYYMGAMEPEHLEKCKKIENLWRVYGQKYVTSEGGWTNFDSKWSVSNTKTGTRTLRSRPPNSLMNI